MKKKALLSFVSMLTCLLAFLIPSQNLQAQGNLTQPRGSQKAKVWQQIGLANVTVVYHRPAVKEREVWGKLVPYDGGTPMPWRAGANDNTVIKFSHAVKVEGQELAAGSYGLHMIPSESDWTIIFSNNSTSWGSFSYDEKEDALRVTVSPTENEHTEFLSYSFHDLTSSSGTLALDWEKKRIPIKVTFDEHEIALTSFRKELRSVQGFSWQGYQQAANYCLTNEINYEEALGWADNAISNSFGAQKNFTTVSTKAKLLAKMGKEDESEKVWAEAEDIATPMELYGYAAQMIATDKEAAFEQFKENAKRDPDSWLSHAGLAAGNRITGNTKEAIKYYKKALEGAPDNWKPSLQTRIDSLEKPEN